MILASFPCHCPVLQAVNVKVVSQFFAAMFLGLPSSLETRLKFGLGMRLNFGLGMRLKFGLGTRLKFVYEEQIECGKQLQCEVEIFKVQIISLIVVYTQQLVIT